METYELTSIALLLLRDFLIQDIPPPIFPHLLMKRNSLANRKRLV